MAAFQEDRRPFQQARLALASFVLLASALLPAVALAQTEVSSGQQLTEEMRAKLLKPGDLTLRDANFTEAMFAVRRVWGVNVVVAGDLKEETLSCEFTDTPLHEILDTILSPRGFGYRPIGNSLVVVKQEALGAMKPLFRTVALPVLFADPKEIKDAVSFYLSERGQIQVVESSKRLVVIDYPERLENIATKVKELDEAARDLRYVGRSNVADAEQQAIDNGTRSATGDQGMLPALPGYDHRAAFFDLKHTKVETIATALQPLLSPLGKLSVVPKDNRLVVFDTPEKLLLIAQALKELDIPRSQVRISALIYDAATEDIRKIGVNWNGTGFKGTNLDASGVAQDSALLSAFTAAGPTAGAANGALAITSLGSSFDVRAVVQALAQSKKSRLLADPNVTVYDHETAKIDIVTEIPFQQLTQSQQGGNIGTTAFREAGVSLQVTPYISDDGTITMDVNPRFSVLVGLTPETNQPIIDRRETTTTVRIRNRETLVIGGLRQKNSINNRSGIPGLMNLHWPIGELFKQKDVTARDGELIVFITPEVLDDCYMGRAREHDSYHAAMPALDCIAAPELPDDGCPIEEWKHRCGCKHCKHGGHSGPCKAPRHGESTPTNVYEGPVEVLPPTEPIQGHDLRELPPPPMRIEEAPGRETRSPRLKPARIESASRKASSPLGTWKSASPDSVKSPPVIAQPRRLPAIEREPQAAIARRPPSRTLFTLPPVEESKRR